MATAPDAEVELPWARRLGRGSAREAWVGEVVVTPDPAGWSGEWVALLPLPGEPVDARKVEREARLLAWLGAQALPVRVPRAPPVVREVLVCGWVAGARLDGEFTPDLEVTAEVARAIHALAPPDFLPGHATRRAHAEEEVRALARFDEPLLREAAAWAAAHLPPDTPASLLHGDLTRDNLLFHRHLPPAVIDWTHAARGDPAADLAWVTRGGRRPFGEPDGLERLVRAIDPEGERLTVAQVRVHELALLAGWVPEDPSDRGGGLNHLRGLARRVLARG